MRSLAFRSVALVAAVLCLALLASCSALPAIVPDMARKHAPPVPFDGTRGPLSAERSKVILDRLESDGGAETNIFDLHLAVEEAIVGSPLTAGNKVELLQDGPTAYQAMITAIGAARDHINMETYIFEDDAVGQRFAAALIAKQQQGVQVNVIRDSVGTLGTPTEFFTRLTDAGANAGHVMGWVGAGACPRRCCRRGLVPVAPGVQGAPVHEPRTRDGGCGAGLAPVANLRHRGLGYRSGRETAAGTGAAAGGTPGGRLDGPDSRDDGPDPITPRA